MHVLCNFTFTWSMPAISVSSLSVVWTFEFHVFNGKMYNFSLFTVSCEGVQCGKGMKCILRKQRPACVCSPSCSRKKRQMGEVCGSDGKTYKHICRLLKRQCRKNKQLTVEYFGKCQSKCLCFFFDFYLFKWLVVVNDENSSLNFT